MRRFKVLGLAVMAVFALASVLSASAFASSPENLPVSASERTYTGGSEGSVTLEGATKVTCTSAPSSGGEAPGATSGTYHIDFKGCTTLGGAVKCQSLGDPKGEILVSGTWSLPWDVLSELLTAILFEQETVHLECATTLVEVKGKVLCLDLEATSSKTTHSFHCIANKTEATEKTYYDGSGNAHTAQLLCSINHGEFKECAELALGTVTYAEAIFADV